MYAIKTILKYLLASFILIQFIQVNISNPINDKSLEIKTPKNIKIILKRACYDCHSNEVKIPWYSNIAPLSWEISRHIDLGRKWVNFSIWEEYTDEQKDKKLKEIYKAVHSVMPLSDYVLLHPEAKMTKKDRNILRNWTGKAPF